MANVPWSMAKFKIGIRVVAFVAVGAPHGLRSAQAR